MNCDITLAGLTARQMVFCDIMWELENKEDVDKFIASLPPAQSQECRTLIHLMIAAIADNVDSVDDAKFVLDRIIKR